MTLVTGTWAVPRHYIPLRFVWTSETCWNEVGAQCELSGFVASCKSDLAQGIGRRMGVYFFLNVALPCDHWELPME